MVGADDPSKTKVFNPGDKILVCGLHPSSDFICEDREGNRWVLPHRWLRGPGQGGDGICAEIMGADCCMWDAYEIPDDETDLSKYPGVLPPSNEAMKDIVFEPLPDKFRGREPTEEETAPLPEQKAQ